MSGGRKGGIAAGAGLGRRHPAVRRLAEASLVLLFVLLPALVVGTQLDAPATVGELRRLTAVLGTGPVGEAHSLVADRFYVVALGELPRTMPDTDAAQAALLARARLGQFAFVAALAALVYLALALARGRVAGLCACAALALLPPVLREGHVLRPETPAAVFGLFAIVLLQCLARLGVGSRGPLGLGAFVQAFGLVTCACVALGVSYAALPTTSLLLVVPGCVLSLAVLQHGWRAVQVVRRRGLIRLPLHSLNRRLLPWTAASLLAPLGVALVVHLAVQGPTEALSPTVAVYGLGPSAAGWRLAVGALAVFGGVAAVLRVGGRFGRRGRIGADLVLLVYCAVQLAWHLANPSQHDALRIAPAFAILLGDGVLSLGALGFGLRRRARITSAPRA
ncbi:MAG: hypothetical protein KDC48_11800 [Planctomycetes bacterium]|nr:hypothetical protein [Planctomycetota bacterium]